MQSLLDGVATALEASLAQDQVRDEANQESLRNELEKLACGSEDLLVHGRGVGKSTRRLREAMVRDAQRVLSDFEAGRLENAQRRVQQLLEHCFACHTRLPEGGESVLGGRIERAVSVKDRELEERVLFLVAARQFGKALTTIEAALRSPGEVPPRTTWLFEAYLKISIRVSHSYEEARDALEDFLKGSDPPRCLGAQVRAWIKGLGELEDLGKLPVDLPTARMLIDEGRRLNQYPADKRGLVHFVAASGLLLRWLEDHDRRGAEEAEAYLLLGVAESHISWGLWTDQTDFFLETAIRLHPHSQLAMQAYSFLKDYMTARHSGASDTFIPDSVQTYLDNLAVLAEPAHAPEKM